MSNAISLSVINSATDAAILSLVASSIETLAKDLFSHGVTSQSPDAFLTDLHAAFPDALISSVKRARHNLRKTMPSVDAFIDGLQQSGLKTFPTLLRQNIDGLI